MKKRYYIGCLAVMISGGLYYNSTTIEKSNPKQLSDLEQRVKSKKKKKKVRLFSEGLIASTSEDDIITKQNDFKMKFSNPETGELEEHMRRRELDFAKTLPQSTNIAFTHRGPFNVGGRTRAFAVDINDDNVLIAGGVSGGIWKSTNGGTTWKKKTANTDFGSVTCLVQDKRPGKSNIWYYGTGEGYGNSAGANSAYFFGNGMFKSIDNGETWTSIESTTTQNTTQFNSSWQLMWNLTLDNSVLTEDIVYAATHDGVFRSNNGGDDWLKVLGSGSGTAYTSNIMVTPTGRTYGFLNSDENVTDRGMHLSNDNGVTWTNITPSDFPGEFERAVFDYSSTNENEVYVFMHTPNFGKHTNTFFDGEDWNSLWKYTYVDTSTSSTHGIWTDLSDNLPDSGTGFATLYTQNGYDMAIKVHPTDSNVVYIGGTNIYRSDDGFSSDTNTTFLGGYDPLSVDTNWDITTNHHPDQHLIYFSEGNSNVMYSINDGGIFKTNDPLAANSNWISLNNGYFTTQLYAVSVNQNQATNTIIAGFQDNGNFVTRNSNPTSSWVLPYNGDGSFSYLSEDEENFYLSVQRGRVGKFSLDATGNKVSFRRIEPKGIDRDGVSFIHPFAVDPSNEDYMFYPVLDTLYRQSNLSGIVENESQQPLADNWDYIAEGLELSGTNKITSVHVTKNNPSHTVYLGTSRRNIYKIADATSANPIVTTLGYKSTEGDKAYSFGYTSCVTSNPDDGNEIVMVNTNYGTRSLAHSSDGGLTWTDISGNLEEEPSGGGDGPSTRWASILPLNNGEKLYFVGTSVGLFATDVLDTLNTKWIQISPDVIGNVVVEQVITRKEDGLVLVATHGNGIFSASISSISDVLNQEEFVPDNTSLITLMQNPTKGNVKFISSKIGAFNIVITETTTGRIAYKRAIDVQNGVNDLNLNLNKGHYTIRLSNTELSANKKLVVL